MSLLFPFFYKYYLFWRDKINRTLERQLSRLMSHTLQCYFFLLYCWVHLICYPNNLSLSDGGWEILIFFRLRVFWNINAFFFVMDYVFSFLVSDNLSNTKIIITRWNYNHLLNYNIITIALSPIWSAWVLRLFSKTRIYKTFSFNPIPEMSSFFYDAKVHHNTL